MHGWRRRLLQSTEFSPATPNDIQALVDAPCRALDVEYKSWRNLNHAEDRAELARDIAALANHGGGHVIFGFDQDTLIPEDTHPFLRTAPRSRWARSFGAISSRRLPATW